MWARPPPPPPSGPQRHYSGYPPPPGDGRGAVRPIGPPVRTGAPPPPQYYHPGTHHTMYHPSYPFAGPGQWAPPPQALANPQSNAIVSRKRPAPESDDSPRLPPALRHHGHDVPSQYSPAYHYPMVPWTGPVGPAPCSLKVKPPKPRPSWPCLRSEMPKETPPPSPVVLTLAVPPPRQQPSANMYLPAPRLPSVSEHLSSSSRFPSAMPPPSSHASASRSSSSPTLSRIRSPTRPAPRSAPIVIDLTQSPSPPADVPHSKTPPPLTPSPAVHAAPVARILPVLLPEVIPTSSSGPMLPFRTASANQSINPAANPPSISGVAAGRPAAPPSALVPTTLPPATTTQPSVSAPVSVSNRTSLSPGADLPFPQTPVTEAPDSIHTSPSSASPVVVRLSPEPRRKRARLSDSSASQSSDDDEEYSSEPESKSASPARPKKRRRGAAPYDPDNRCSYCNKTFSRPDNLKRHIRIHTGERPWPCLEPGCNKSFVDSGDRDKHARIHTGAKPYRCPQCTKTFSDSSALRRHKRDPRSDFACRED